MYTVSGACDVQGSINGLTFLKRGVTLSGAPWFQAIDSETYLYWDPDCMGSTDGTPRWIIDHDKPDVTKKSDLDNDHFCDYVGRINSDDLRQPPVQGLWTLNCGGTWQQSYIILLEGTTTQIAPAQGSGKLVRTTTTMMSHLAPSAKEVPESSWELSGACELKNFLNGLVYDQVGTTADGRPFFKAQTLSEYIYFDRDCDGLGGADPKPRWLLDNSRPSTTALQDLDEDGECNYHARLDGSTQRPPASATWRMYCGAAEGGWANVDLRLQEVQEAAPAPTARSAILSSAPRSPAPLLAVALAAACAWLLAP